MGNCLLGGMGDRNPAIRVATSNGGVMEFRAPITVESIIDEFPRHGIFRSHDLFWKPLPRSNLLLAGESYNLLPLCRDTSDAARGVGHVRSNSAPPRQKSGGSAAAPYRMSFDSRGLAKRLTTADDADHVAKCGFWKVKLVISPAQLLEILAEDGRTEELIESVRTVAKCGSGGGFSDQWSLSSSRNTTSSANKDSSSLLEF